jgi:proteasome lid subunit RPN8/RPN11
VLNRGYAPKEEKGVAHFHSSELAGRAEPPPHIERRSRERRELIALTDNQLAEIRQHGERDYPFECCGLMLGRFESEDRKTVVETYPISNAREEDAKRNRFLIRPEELMRGERHAREKGLDVVGFYHSHPDARAVPSQYDLEHAWPTYSYVVVAVEKGRAVDLQSWEMEPDRSQFNEEEITQTSLSEADPEGRPRLQNRER